MQLKGSMATIGLVVAGTCEKTASHEYRFLNAQAEAVAITKKAVAEVWNI
jgi:hypothetical protein